MAATSAPQQEKVVQLSSELVSIDSVNLRYPGATHGEREIARYVEHYYQRLGLDVESYEVAPNRPNVIAQLPCPHPVGTILLDSHTDTVSVVPVGEALFRPEIRAGRLYGRGACDDKGPLAAMMIAMERLLQRRSELRVNVIALASVDEESGGSGINSFIDRGFVVDAAVVGEPTELKVVRAHKGNLIWRVTALGRAAHTSKPENGVNAIYQIMPVLQAIREEVEPSLSAITHPLLTSPTITVTMIEGGAGLNIVPAECAIALGRRTLPNEDVGNVVREMRELFARLQHDNPGLELRVVEPQIEPVGLDTPVDAPIVQAARRAAKMVTGDDQPVGVPCGSHARWLSGRGDIPCVLLGPGCVDDAHTANESISLEELTKAPALYEEIVLNFGEMLASAKR